jgi:hypothetical protein
MTESPSLRPEEKLRDLKATIRNHKKVVEQQNYLYRKYRTNKAKCRKCIAKRKQHEHWLALAEAKLAPLLPS